MPASWGVRLTTNICEFCQKTSLLKWRRWRFRHKTGDQINRILLFTSKIFLLGGIQLLFRKQVVNPNLWLLWQEKQSVDMSFIHDGNSWFDRTRQGLIENLSFTCWQECAALCWESSSCANGLPSQRNQRCVSVISFRCVFVALVTLNRKTDGERRLNWERKLLRLLRWPQNDWVLGLFQLLHCRAASACEYQINLQRLIDLLSL